MNISIAENFMRSAKAPQISAGVMIAKVIWNIMKTDSGMVARQRADVAVGARCPIRKHCANAAEIGVHAAVR